MSKETSSDATFGAKEVRYELALLMDQLLDPKQGCGEFLQKLKGPLGLNHGAVWLKGKEGYQVFCAYPPMEEGVCPSYSEQALDQDALFVVPVSKVKALPHYAKGLALFMPLGSFGYLIVCTEKFKEQESLKTYGKQLKEVVDRLSVLVSRGHTPAKESSETQRRVSFLTHMSHEIRTPMNVVVGMTRLLQESQLTTEQARYLQMIGQASASLLRTIEDVVDFAKVESDGLEITQVQADPFEVVETTLNGMVCFAHQKGLELVLDQEHDLSLFLGDPRRMEQVLANLVRLMIRCTQKKEITLHVKKKQGDVCFAVREGVYSKEDTPLSTCRLLDVTDASILRFSLGLELCEHIVSRMGGALGYASYQEGREFFFTVPMKEPVAERKSLPRYALEVGVLEPHQAQKETLVARLEALGCKIVTDTREMDALLIADTAEGDGIKVAERFMNEKGWSTPIVLMLKSGDIVEQAKRCDELGVLAYLVKPVSTTKLRGFLASWDVETYKKPTEEEKERHRPFAGAKILLVEDRPMNQVLAQVLLQRVGYRVVLARTGEEALKEIATQRFHAVFMDIQMPGMDGLACTKQIRRGTSENREVPIIAMTASVLAGDKKRCLDAGMDYYVSKPIQESELYAILYQAITKAHHLPTQPLFHHLRTQLGGDEALVKEVVRAFLDDAWGDLIRLKKAIEDEDSVKIQELAHGLKGEMGSLGISTGMDYARELEQKAREKSMEGTVSLFRELEVLVVQVEQWLKANP